MAAASASAQQPPVVMPPPPKPKITSSVMLWTLEGSFESRVRTAADTGLQTVELQDEYSAWDDAQLKRAKRLVGSFGMNVQTLSATPNWQSRPVSMVNAQHREAFLSDLRNALKTARKLESPYVLLTSGNELPGHGREEQYASLLEASKQASELAAAADITLLARPLNNKLDHKQIYLSTSAEALKLVKEVDNPHFRLLFSTYDEQVQTGNALASLRDALEYTEVIHIAEAPGRAEPGPASREIYRAIQKGNYTRTLGMEYKPKGGAVASLRRAIDQFRAAVNERVTPIPTETPLV
jgi:hydroxypyruvate isomerase